MDHLNDIRHYRRNQLDRSFADLRRLLPPLPKRGWIAEIRSLLLMTTTQLARRIGVAQSVASTFEKSEREKSITLKSLERAADALECDVHYFFVPRNGLEAELYARAERIYQANQKRLEQHMKLEAQGTGSTSDARKALEVLKLYRKVWAQDEA